VSTEAKPVTVKDEVEVSNASKKFVETPDEDAIGNIRRAVPRRIKTVKAAAIDCVGESFGSFIITGSNLFAIA
jgi:hypothetical protein